MTFPAKVWRAARTLAALPVAAWKSFTTLTLHTSEWFKGLTASWSKPSYETLAKKVHRNPYGTRGLRLVSQTMASVPIVVMQETPDGEEPLADHPILDILKRPNPRQNRRHFFDALVNHIYCGGEFFLERKGATTRNGATGVVRTDSIHLHSPGRFQDFLRDQSTLEITGYQISDLRGKSHKYGFDEMYHGRVYHPTDEERGLPLLIGAHRAIETMEAADDWNKSIATGGGRIPGFWKPQGLPPGQQLTEDQVEQAEQNLDKRTKERKTSNLGMVLSGAFDWENTTVSPKDAEWLEGDKHNARKIAAVIGYDPALVGDSANRTYSNLKEARRALYLLTVLPLLDWVLEELNAWLVPFYGEGLRLAYDLDQIEAIQEDMSDKYRRYKDAAGRPFLSADEARVALGWEPVGDEDIYVPIGMQPAGEPPEPPVLRALRSIDEDDFGNLIKALAV